MSPTEQTVAAFINQQILRNEPAAELGVDRALLEEGLLDSLALQQLVTFIEAEFSFSVADDYLTPENFESVRAIAGMVDKLRK